MDRRNPQFVWFARSGGKFDQAEADASVSRAFARARFGMCGAFNSLARAGTWSSGNIRRKDFNTTSDSRKQVLKSYWMLSSRVHESLGCTDRFLDMSPAASSNSPSSCATALDKIRSL